MKNETLRIFSTNLEYLMKKKDISGVELAQKMGVSKQSVSTWVRGLNVPRTDKLDKLCEILDCDRNALLMRSPATDLFDMRPVPPQGMLPVIGLASCGKGVIASEDVIEYVAADASHCNDEHYYLEITGDSMAPVFSDGDLVLVHRQTSVDSGDVGVFIVDGEEGYIKKVKYDAENIDLISYNPYYPPMHFEGPDVLRVYVVGKVLEQKRRAFP